MSDDRCLEDLLRATSLRVGRIAIDTMDGVNWRASVSHFNGRHVHQPHPFGDPVEALRVALIEDERQQRDLVRRYDAAPKLGAAPPAAVDDTEDLLG